jgi:tetratricopeptide (TPR) repeat protein
MYDEAVGHAQKTVELSPEPKESFAQVNEALAQQRSAQATLAEGPNPLATEKYGAATQKLARANQALGTILAATDIVAQANLELRNFPKAEEAARQSVELARERVRIVPHDMERLNDLNAAYLLTLTALERRQEVFPEQADVYIGMAEVIKDQADLVLLMTWHQALQRLELGVQNTAPNVPPNLLMEVATLQYNVGRTDDAVKTLDFLLKKQPDHVEGRKLRERIAGPLSASSGSAP